MMRTAAVAALAAVAAVPAASADESPKAKSSAQVTLRFSGMAEYKPQLDLAIARFERANPNINIEQSYVPFAQYGSAMLTGLQSGNWADVFNTSARSGCPYCTRPLAAAGRLLDLTGAPWDNKKDPSRQLWSRSGKRYSLPLAMDTAGITINKQVMSRLGLKPAKTFSELLSQCRTISARGVTPISVGLIGTNQASIQSAMVATFVYGADPKWNAKRNKNQVTFANSKNWQRMWRGIKQLTDTKCFPTGAAGVTTQAAQTALANGQAAMGFGSGTDLTILKRLNPSGSFGVMPVPGDTAKGTRVGLLTALHVVTANAKTEYPSQAKTFINFLARDRANYARDAGAGSLAADAVYKGNVPSTWRNGAMVSSLKAGRWIESPNAYWANPSINTGVLIPGVGGVVTGQRTAQQILSRMDELWAAG